MTRMRGGEKPDAAVVVFGEPHTQKAKAIAPPGLFPL